MKKILIDVWGGFHDTRSVVTLRIDSDYINPDGHYGPDWVSALSKAQLKRANRHLCGLSDCKCGGVNGNGVQWSENIMLKKTK